MDSLTFIIAILATWRLSALLSYETGPFDMFIRIREYVGIEHDDYGNKITSNESVLANLLDCVWCVSVWIGGAMAIGLFFYPVLFWLLLPFALSAGAIIVEKINHAQII